MPINIIFDTDAAHDDVIALVYLARNPKIKFKAITVAGTGEAYGKHGAGNMASLCNLLGLTDVPIAYGRDTPLNDNGGAFPEYLREMVNGLLRDKDIPQAGEHNITDQPVALFKKIIEESNEKITILATGPLTNVAEFITQHPELLDKIEKIIIMGGAVRVSGNVHTAVDNPDAILSEWNFYADPGAAAIVMAANIPITLVPLDATNLIPMTEIFYATLAQEQLRDLQIVFLALDDFVKKLGKERFFSRFYFWDPLAAMICVNESIAQIENLAIVVNPQTGQTKIYDSADNNTKKISVVTGISNVQTLLADFINHIKENNQRTSPRAISQFWQSQRQSAANNPVELVAPPPASQP